MKTIKYIPLVQPIARRLAVLWCFMVLGVTPGTIQAAEDVMVYEDALAPGWSDWSWDTTTAASTDQVKSGDSSLAVTHNVGWAGLSLRTGAPLNGADYKEIRFWIYGSPGASTLRLSTQAADSGEQSDNYTFTPTVGQWTEIVTPLSTLGSPTQIARINLMNGTSNAQPTYYVDALRVVGKPVALTLKVDPKAARKNISPYIYGMNSYSMSADSVAFMAELNLPVRRWGGNNTSRYNWHNDISNTAADWYFENVKMSDAVNLPADSAVNRFINQNRTVAVETLLTIPMIGYVAKNDSQACGFSISKYGPQQDNDWEWRPDCGDGVKMDGSLVMNNNPADTSITTDPNFVRNWVKYLKTTFGGANNGGVRFYNLDNEVDIWYETHRDVFPVALTYDHLRDRTYQYAAAIKAADPNAKILGPVLTNWTYYWNSPYDVQRNDLETPHDRNAHGGTPLVPWYLQQMKDYQTANGKRILDYLDLHYYPAAPGVTLAPAGNADMQALRLRSTRSLWDPTYVDESWISDDGTDGGVVKLIPRMRAWVNNYYPGTRLAISEYNWGALDHINGALAQADVLGIFGREGLHLATLWEPPGPDQPGAFAFRLYRNYDGSGGKFGDISVKAVSTNQGRLAVYAAEESGTGALTIIVINKTGGALTAPLSLLNFAPSTGAASVYRYSAADLTRIVHPADKAIINGKISNTYPANSITLYRVPGSKL